MRTHYSITYRKLENWTLPFGGWAIEAECSVNGKTHHEPVFVNSVNSEAEAKTLVTFFVGQPQKVRKVIYDEACRVQHVTPAYKRG